MNDVKNKNNKFVFFIKVFVLCIIESIILYYINSPIFFQFLSKYILDIKLFGGYSIDIVKELIVFIFVVLIIVLTKNKKYSIFAKKEKFGKSILKGWPIFLCALPELLFWLYEVIFIDKGCNYYAVIGLVCYCFLIGLTEELLCRGFVQNEFTSRYGKTYKTVFLSIFLSSVLFGLLHFTNFFLGQSLFNTIMQVLQNICWSMVVGAIYYKTQNIWSVVWIHTLDDFILMFDEILPLQNYLWNYNPIVVQILKIVIIVLSMVIYILYSIKLLKKKDSNKILIIESKSNKNPINSDDGKNYNFIIIFLITVYILLELLFISLHLN